MVKRQLDENVLQWANDMIKKACWLNLIGILEVLLEMKKPGLDTTGPASKYAW